MAPEPKRRKIKPPPLRRTGSSSSATKTKDVISVPPGPPPLQAHGVDFRIERAKNFAVAQAQQDGCTGN